MAALTAPRPLAPARPAVRPGPSLRDFGPNWYAAVMGTSIVANAAAAIPGGPSSLRAAGTRGWALAPLLLVTVLAVRAAHWVLHRDRARPHLLDPAVAPFYGCLSMAFLSVGAGALSVGARLVGAGPALLLDAALWPVGAAVSVLVAAGVPYLMVARHRIAPQDASPVWLLPVVGPMVAAAPGPPLVGRLPAGAGQAREALLLGCAAMFGMSLLATLMMLPLVFCRLVRTGLPPVLAPTLFLVLGPLGQSTTAAGSLADAAPSALPGRYAAAFDGFAVLYGVPVTGFALLWLAVSAALVVRAARGGMRFSMTWWAFTFPGGDLCDGRGEPVAAHRSARA